MYPTSIVSSRREALYVAVLMYSLMVALYFPKQAATRTGTSFVIPSRQGDCTVAPVPRAGGNLCRRTSRSGGVDQALSGATFNL